MQDELQAIRIKLNERENSLIFASNEIDSLIDDDDYIKTLIQVHAPEIKQNSKTLKRVPEPRDPPAPI